MQLFFSDLHLSASRPKQVELFLECLKKAGKEALIGSILGDVDDKAGMPVSQVIGHMLYFFKSRPVGDVRDAALVGVQRGLAADGLGLVVLDAYRPDAVEQLVWAHTRGPAAVRRRPAREWCRASVGLLVRREVRRRLRGRDGGQAGLRRRRPPL